MEVLKWVVAGGHIDSVRSSEHRLGPKTLADRAETDNLVGVIDVAVTVVDPGFYPPRQELRIAINVSDEVEQLFLRITK